MASRNEEQEELESHPFYSLRPGSYICDTVVNQYLRVVVNTYHPRVYALNPRWKEWPLDRTFAEATAYRQAIAAANVFLFPIHVPKRSHWLCGAVDVARHMIYVYDSLGGRSSPVPVSAQRHALACKEQTVLLLVAAGRRPEAENLRQMTVRYWTTPKQTTSTACGVHMLLAFEYLSRMSESESPMLLDLAITSGRVGEDYARALIADELLRRRLRFRNMPDESPARAMPDASSARDMPDDSPARDMTYDSPARNMPDDSRACDEDAEVGEEQEPQQKLQRLQHPRQQEVGEQAENAEGGDEDVVDEQLHERADAPRLTAPRDPHWAPGKRTRSDAADTTTNVTVHPAAKRTCTSPPADDYMGGDVEASPSAATAMPKMTLRTLSTPITRDSHLLDATTSAPAAVLQNEDLAANLNKDLAPNLNEDLAPNLNEDLAANLTDVHPHPHGDTQLTVHIEGDATMAGHAAVAVAQSSVDAGDPKGDACSLWGSAGDLLASRDTGPQTKQDTQGTFDLLRDVTEDSPNDVSVAIEAWRKDLEFAEKPPPQDLPDTAPRPRSTTITPEQAAEQRLHEKATQRREKRIQAPAKMAKTKARRKAEADAQREATFRAILEEETRAVANGQLRRQSMRRR